MVGLGSLLMALSLVAFPMLQMSIVYGMFVVAVIGLVAFLLVELRTPQPMLDLQLFADRLFGFASLAGALKGLARGAVLFVLIFFLQGPYGQDPLMAGLMMTPFGAAFLLVGPLSGYLSDHYGSRLLSTAGLLVSAVGRFGLSTVTSTSPFWVIAVYMVANTGQMLSIAIAFPLVLSRIPQDVMFDVFLYVGRHGRRAGRPGGF